MNLPDWVAAPELAVLWQRVRARLESTGPPPHGRVTVPVGSRAERHAVGGLLGRSVTRTSVAVDLGALDRRLAERSGIGGLAAVLEALTGMPLRDRPRERRELSRRRSEPLALAGSLVDGPWVPEWLDGLRRTGLLTNRPDAVRIVSGAAAVLKTVVGADVEWRSRTDLGARLIGDSHALDEDRVEHLVVLRGLAAAAGVAMPATPGDRRALWLSYGIEPDQLSSTCLVLGLRPPGADSVCARLRLAAEAGDPVHLTTWDVRRCDLSGAVSRPVLVCENPRVLEAVAETHRGRVPVICTSGEPNTVVTTVLSSLAAADLWYHGDFDWPGIAIANRLVARFGVNPWLMAAPDYEDAVRPGAPALAGTPVEPSWDTELGAAMRHHGVAVHEEAVLPTVLASLWFGGDGRGGPGHHLT